MSDPDPGYVPFKHDEVFKQRLVEVKLQNSGYDKKSSVQVANTNSPTSASKLKGFAFNLTLNTVTIAMLVTAYFLLDLYRNEVQNSGPLWALIMSSGLLISLYTGACFLAKSVLKVSAFTIWIAALACIIFSFLHTKQRDLKENQFGVVVEKNSGNALAIQTSNDLPPGIWDAVIRPNSKKRFIFQKSETYFFKISGPKEVYYFRGIVSRVLPFIGAPFTPHDYDWVVRQHELYNFAYSLVRAESPKESIQSEIKSKQFGSFKIERVDVITQ